MIQRSISPSSGEFISESGKLAQASAKVCQKFQMGTLTSPFEISQTLLSTTPSKTCSSMTTKVIGHGEIPISPPISPETKTSTPHETNNILDGPTLYSASHNTGHDASAQSLLFPDENDPHKVVEHHMATRAVGIFRILSPPQVNEYTLALEFKSQIGKAFNANPRQWAQRELAQLKEDNRLRARGKIIRQSLKTTSSATSRTPIKKKCADRSLPVDKTMNVQRVDRAFRVRKNANRGDLGDGSKRVAREDKNFDSLPDFCPPLSSLPNKVNSLKVDWKGVPIDLRSDPFAHLLHPDEVQLAANLRLDCATYLTSKRRIFISRVAASRIGKDFRKTDAQQACKIDVNKASKLWQAFDKVGWLHSKWVPD